jgi:hypothetical protein
MVVNVDTPRIAGRAARPRAGALGVVLMLVLALAGLAGCGSSGYQASPAAHVSTVTPTVSVSNGCSEAVLTTLSSVVQRVYREGVLSERTASAEYLIASSTALRAAVESGSPTAARAAARALLATGHLTNVTVMRDSKTLVDVGGPALAPLHGTLTGAGGAPIGSYVASVWADEGFLIEAGGITQGLVALRAGEHSLGGSSPLGTSALADSGSLTRAGVPYRYTSFPAVAYPSGAMRVYVLLPTSKIAPLCGRTPQDTMIDTLERVAKLIYTGEIGRAAQIQLRRMQRDTPLLEAVSHREPEAARLAIDAVLDQHVVRIRVSVDGTLLEDVGGPYVLGPVSAPLRQHGRTIGAVTLSIQDDEGYLRLARRLAGLDVLMYMYPNSPHPQLVKNSLDKGPGPALAAVPASGPYKYLGHSYQVFTVHAQAFPSGPLAIRVLVPIPYPTEG